MTCSILSSNSPYAPELCNHEELRHAGVVPLRLRRHMRLALILVEVGSRTTDSPAYSGCPLYALSVGFIQVWFVLVADLDVIPLRGK